MPAGRAALFSVHGARFTVHGAWFTAQESAGFSAPVTAGFAEVHCSSDTRLSVTAVQDSASRRHKTRRHGGTRLGVTPELPSGSESRPAGLPGAILAPAPASAVSGPTRGGPEFIAPLSDRISELLPAYFVFRPALFQY